MTKRFFATLVVATALAFLWPLVSQPYQQNPIGASLSNLPLLQASLFQSGRQKFLEVEDVATGLGPAFNGTSCAGCHNQPVIGGFGNAAVMRDSGPWKT